MNNIFVTFYDIHTKTKIAFMIEMPIAPNENDIVFINKKWYKVLYRAFNINKPLRVCVYVEEYNK